MKSSLQHISRCLYKHFDKKVIFLIDEYDVPLEAVFKNGYYDRMTRFLRSFLSQALKSNVVLEKAVLTGCLRIAKESIFTGLNNFSSYSFMMPKAAASFGFTQEEVNRIYTDYGFQDKLPEVKKWYDGYRFGEVEIYNPWSALKYIEDLRTSSKAEPLSYWANSSSNDLITRYIQKADPAMLKEFQALINGQSVIKKIQSDLTYREMEDPDNVYSLLLLTGYLKPVEKVGGDEYRLVIPNREVRKIYEDHFTGQFKKLKKKVLPELIQAMAKEDPERIQKLMSHLLDQYITFYDSSESFYHGFLLGAFSQDDLVLESNKESGDGRFDIRLTSDSYDLAVVLECKRAQSRKEMAALAKAAAK